MKYLKWEVLHERDVTTRYDQQTNFSLATSFWGICLLSAFIFLRWL